jgi:multimeric flavodoxin WrbA
MGLGFPQHTSNPLATRAGFSRQAEAKAEAESGKGRDMKAVILDGSRQGDASSEKILKILHDALEAGGWAAERLSLARMDIADCLGCFGCWLRTPGECLLKDDGQKVAAAVIGSDLSIFFTPVTFGGYSAELKKGLDRLICLILPLFMKVSGEVHHQPRYEKYPRLMGVGVQRSPDREGGEIFSALLRRNAINLHAPGFTVNLMAAGQDETSIRESLDASLMELGGTK